VKAETSFHYIYKKVVSCFIVANHHPLATDVTFKLYIFFFFLMKYVLSHILKKPNLLAEAGKATK
jgi:hypothetical protein